MKATKSKYSSRHLAFLAVLFLSVLPCVAQQLPEAAKIANPLTNIDSVDMATGLVSLHIPLLSDTAQRGGKMDFNYSIVYSSPGTWTVRYDLGNPNGQWWPSSGLVQGANVIMEGGLGAPSQTSTQEGWAWQVTEASGASHAFGCADCVQTGGPSYANGTSFRSADGSGILVTNPSQGSGIGLGVVTNMSGVQFHYNENNPYVEDANGNEMTIGACEPAYFAFDSTQFVWGSCWNMYDTLNRTWTLDAGVSASSCPQQLPGIVASVWTTPGPSAFGSVRPFLLCYAPISIQTSLGAGYQEYVANPYMLVAVVLPNGTNWQFSYDNWGTLTQVSLPTGGNITYGDYSFRSDYCTGGYPRGPYLRTVYDGTHSNQWTYSIGIPYANNTVTDPMGNQTVYSSSCGPYLHIDQIQYYTGGASPSNLLKTVNESLGEIQDPLSASGYVLFPQGDTTTLPNYEVKQTWMGYAYSFDYIDPQGNDYQQVFGSGSAMPFNIATYFENWDWGNGSVLSGQTTAHYAWAEANSPYLAANLLDLIYWHADQGPGGTWCSGTTYAYDGSSVVSSNISTQRLPLSAGAVRGNVSSVTSSLFNGCQVSPSPTLLTSTYTSYDTGMVQQATDAKGNPTTFSYNADFAGALPTQTCNAKIQCSNYWYDWPGLVLAWSQDPNEIAAGTETTYAFDNMLRPTSVSHSSGAQTTLIYSDVTPIQQTQKTKITGSANPATTIQTFDGLGRQTQTQVTSDPGGTDTTLITFDGNGRTATVTNPYRSTSDPTYGVTTYSYDGLNRITSVTNPDGTAVTTWYVGYCTGTMDEAGKGRKTFCTDGLGRTTRVWEDPLGLAYETDYSYDPLGNLLSVVQNGSRTRTFTYDSLSRLLTATNPESGTVSYSYDADGNFLTRTTPQANQTGTATTTTTYCYDPLNRLTQKRYIATSCPVSSPDIAYLYDGSACPTGLTCYNIGQRTGMTDAAGSEAWSYYYVSGTGTGVTDQRTTNSISNTTAYTYNYDGSPATLTYPSGRTVTYAVNAAGQLTSAVDTTNSITYANAALYGPQGALLSLTNGSSSTIVSKLYYNQRLQPCRIAVNTNSTTAPGSCTDSNTGNVLDLAYSFGTSNNGNVAGITNNVDTTRSQSFSYDALNRLTAAQTASTFSNSPAHCWGETFGFDAWANFLSIGAVSSAYNGCTQESLSLTVNTNNQLSVSGYVYDAAGNLTTVPNPGGATYTYNAEGQMTQAAGSSTVGYVYDGDGKRVEKTSSGSAYKLYWYDTGGNVLDETDGSGSTTNSSFFEYVFFGGARIARRDSSGNILYYFGDHLGTSRTIVQAGQTTACYDADFYPFGGERAYTSSCTQNYKFTGQERDAETNMDYMGARAYASSMGRFMSPDPSGISLANLSDPQQLNLYAYVRNNPLNATDPTGKQCQASEYLVDPDTGQVEDPSEETDQNDCEYAGGIWTDDSGGGGSVGGGGDSPDPMPTSCGGGPGCVAFGYDIFDAIGPNAPGASLNANSSWGFNFSSSAWSAAMNAQDQAMLADPNIQNMIQARQAQQQLNLATAIAAVNGQTVQAVMSELGLSPEGTINGNTNFQPNAALLGQMPPLTSTWGQSRNGDIHYKNNLFHLDHGNPFSDLIGALSHLVIDNILGRMNGPIPLGF